MDMSKIKPIQPVLKWVGGKRQLLDEIIPLVPEFNRYFEVFLGGGALLFALQPKIAIVNDYNKELINCYGEIESNCEGLINRLKQFQNTEEEFYRIRDIDRTPEYNNLTNAEKAARLIYLNKTCFNGLYRVNSAGEFNAPYGRYKNPNIVNEEGLRAVSKYLNENTVYLLNGDFKQALKKAKKGDFVYLDPPYYPISKTSAYTGYTDKGFTELQQITLKRECDNLNKKGVKFLQSNSDCPFIRDLYKDYCIKTVQAKRNINAKGDGRKPINEVLIYNY